VYARRNHGAKENLMVKKILLASCVVCLVTWGISADTGKLAFVSGKVDVTSGGKSWQKAKLGAIVNEGESVRTGANGAVIIVLKSGATLKLKSQSQIKLSEIGNATTIDVSGGSVFSKVDKRQAGQTYRIRAQTMVAAVRGTEFYFAYGQAKKKKADMWLCVNEGQVNVTDSSSASNVDVNAGEGIIIPVGKAIPKPKAYAWIKKLNWNMDASKGAVIGKSSMRGAYKDLLKNNYD
jgi:hypothetical protein